MKKMEAKYTGRCEECGGPINKGEPIYWSRRDGAIHANCYTGRIQDPHGQNEYNKGVQDYNNWKFNQSVFGEEAAARMEFERELREGWDY